MTMTTVLEDDFSYPNEPLAATPLWELHNTTTSSEGWEIVNQSLVLPATAARRSCQVMEVFNSDQWASVEVFHTDNNAVVDMGVGLCFGEPSETENHYRFVIKSLGGANSNVQFAIARMVNGAAKDLVSTGQMTRPTSPILLRGRKEGSDLFLDVNDEQLLNVSDLSFSNGSVGVTGFAGGMTEGWSLDNFKSGNIVSGVPEINPSETDVSLTNGVSQQLVFTGLTSLPVNVSLRYGGTITHQTDFSIGELVEGVATANFTAAIGNLPYTDINHSPIDYSYVVTCEDSSELTLSGISISPSTSRSLVAANNPVNDSTSIISQWIEGLAQSGDQIDYPKQVENVTLTVNPDFTHTGVVPEGEEFPSSISFDINYWDSVSGERYPVTVEISFKENNSEILEFVPSSTDAISIEFFASSEGFVNELIPSSTDSINVTFDQPVRINEQLPAPTDSIIIFYGENLFTPSPSRTLYIKP